MIAKFVGKKILGETVANKFGTDDPYFESVPATRLDGTPSGKVKKRRKALPPGLSQNDEKVLTKVKRRAYRLDMCLWNCCGIRFGWSSVIGIVPAIGDVLDLLLALMVLRTCGQIEGGLPTAVKSKMMFNIILDFAVGLVPFLGDVADAAFRANTRNAAILESYLREKGKKTLRQSGLPVPDIDPSDPQEWDRMQEQGTPEQVSSPPSRNETMNASGNSPGNHGVASPAPAQMRENRSNGLGSLFGSGRSRPADLEMGRVDNGASSAARLQKQQQPRH